MNTVSGTFVPSSPAFGKQSLSIHQNMQTYEIAFVDAEVRS